MILLNILVFVLILGAIVAIHELGHLIFAKKAGILCYEYSLGFGPQLYNKKGKETDFSVRAIPLGGFVSMAGEQTSTEMIKKGQTIGLNLEDGKIKEIILTNKVKSEIIMEVTNFEIYDEKETGNLFIEGMVDGNTVNFEILESATYVVTEKQKLKIAPYKRCFESKNYWQKFLTLIAGPGMNFLLAIFLFFIVASVQGKPQNTNVVGATVDNFPASVLGLKENDQIISIGGHEIVNWNALNEAYGKLTSYDNVEIVVKRKGQTTEETLTANLAIDVVQLGISNFTKDGVLFSENGAVIGNTYGYGSDVLKEGDIIQKIKYHDNDEIIINSWFDLIEAVKDFDGEKLVVTFLRNDEQKTTEMHVWEQKVLKSQGQTAYSIMLGVSPQRKFSLGYSLGQSFVGVWNSFYQVITTVGLLLGGSKQIGVNDLSGPIGIFNIIGQVMKQGFISLLAFTAFLSVNVGVLNLLPIPALDGGRVLFITYEGISRRKISRKAENIINNVFFILLMLLFVYVTINDVLRIFR